jgi:type II secretory pathway pseudopilin PulG
MIKKLDQKNGGYTLVELIVGIGLFTTAISFLVAIFIQGLRSQKLLNSLLELQSNSGLLMEQVMRETRLGFNFQALPATSQTCGDLGLSDQIEFYRLVRGERIKTTYTWEETNKRLIRTVEDSLGGIKGNQVNADSVLLNRFCFLLNPAEGVPRTNPWRITISANAGSSNPRISNRSLDFQTTVAARVLPSEVLPIIP